MLNSRSYPTSSAGLPSHPGNGRYSNSTNNNNNISTSRELSNIHHAHSNYEEVSVLGHGAYGIVYKARDLQNNGEFVALKRIRVQTSEDGLPLSTIREISALRHLEGFEHPNIVRLLDICPGPVDAQDSTILTLVFEHVEQDLAAYLEKSPSPGLGPDRIKDLMRQLLVGVDFLHSNRLVHRDLKPQNILITGNGQLKLADFGLARVYSFATSLTSVVVTLWYRAPEVLLQTEYATPVDIWSCACIFAEMVNRRPLCRGESDIDQLNKIFEVIGLPDQNLWPNDISISWSSLPRFPRKPLDTIVPELDELGVDLLQKMLQFKPGSRLSAQEALSHRYFGNDEETFSSSPSFSSPLSRSSRSSSESSSTSDFRTDMSQIAT